MKDRITIEGRDGTFGAYIARPETIAGSSRRRSARGVRGERRHSQDTATNWPSKASSRSRQTYSGVRSRASTSASLQSRTGSTAFASIKPMTGTPAPGTLRTPANAVAKLPECTGKVAVLGYCLGALMTFLTAVRYGVDAAVAYHGGDTEKYLGEVDGLHAPLLMHLAEEDEFISKPAQAQIKAALASKPNATVYSYPGQRHAFTRHNGAHYNAAAAALANGRTSEFLNQQLR